ncbi:MAG: hypothetical protein U0746_08320 [Gemmataceae bacterium]
MNAQPVVWPTADDATQLLNALLAGDATAPAEFTARFLSPLISRLRDNNPHIDDHLCVQAAGDAVFNLIKQPTAYDPSRGDLPGYLTMSARGDLWNALRKEQKHRHLSLEAVELSPRGGNILGRDDDPAFRLRIAEEAPELPDAVRDGLTPEQGACLDLLLAGVRRNDEYAAALGLTDRPRAERDREVKRVKDMLKKRLKRSEAGRGPAD